MASTYLGLLLGYPNAEINRHILEEDLRRARELGKTWDLEPHVIPPPRKSSEVRGRPVEILPLVSCVGMLEGPPRDPDDDGSHAVVVWYQDGVQLPDAPFFAGLDWVAISKGFGF